MDAPFLDVFKDLIKKKKRIFKSLVVMSQCVAVMLSFFIAGISSTRQMGICGLILILAGGAMSCFVQSSDLGLNKIPG